MVPVGDEVLPSPMLIVRMIAEMMQARVCSIMLVDTQKNEFTGKAYLKPFETVRAGVPFGRPYPLPFSVPA